MAWECGGKPSRFTINNTGHTGDQSRVCPHSEAAIWPSGLARIMGRWYNRPEFK